MHDGLETRESQAKAEATPEQRVQRHSSGQNEHRQIGIEDTDLLKDFFSVFEGQIQVENGQIRHFLAERFDRSSSIQNKVDSMPIHLEAALQEETQRLIVFGNQ
jgi:hypothetical protein